MADTKTATAPAKTAAPVEEADPFAGLLDVVKQKGRPSIADKWGDKPIPASVVKLGELAARTQQTIPFTTEENIELFHAALSAYAATVDKSVYTSIRTDDAGKPTEFAFSLGVKRTGRGGAKKVAAAANS